MILTKLFIALAIGFGYSFASVTTLATGTSAVLKRGLRGGLVAGSGVALGLCFYATIAITGLGLVQYFLRPVHLAIIEVSLGVLFTVTGLFLLLHHRKHKQPKKPKTPTDHKRGLWPYFVTNLLIILTSPQKAAYIAGLFLFFKLHITIWQVKAAVPVLVLIGSLLAWIVYSIVVARGGRKLAHASIVQRCVGHITGLGRRPCCLAVRRAWVNHALGHKLIVVGKSLLLVVGVVLVVKGVWLFASWGFDPWSAGAVRG